MASIEQNQAAWLTAAQANPLEIGPGPDQSTVEVDEVVIKVSHVAINPWEWKVQDYAFIPLQYPFVLGTDVAGEIVKVGPGVTKFKIGDRVIGHCIGAIYGGAKHGGFQTFTTCLEILVAKIPDSLAFAEAVVMPLSISTAIDGLFRVLELDLPVLGSKPNGKVVLIWGGSSSCGSTAIQLAVAAGYTVATTASTKNHAYVKSLGATHVFDYGESGDIERLKAMKVDAVFDCIAEGNTMKTCATIVQANGGVKFPTVLPSSDHFEGVEVVTVFGPNSGTTYKALGNAIWGEFVPQAFASGKLQAKPEPQIITGGLSKIQEALNILKQGVSARKIVVEL